MKKFFSVLLFFLVFNSVSAQVTIGLRVAPHVSITSVSVDGNNPSGISAGDAGLRYTIGPIVDAFFSDNYAFSSGVWFTTRVLSTKAQTPTGKVESKINAQYVQIPLSIKLFTNEISDDLKLYFQLGSTLDILIYQKLVDAQPEQTADLRTFNLGLLAGAGVEYQMGTNTSLFGGFAYNRGLINTVGDSKSREFLQVNSNQIGLEIGIKF
jgi:hypothetical protein